MKIVRELSIMLILCGITISCATTQRATLKKGQPVGYPNVCTQEHRGFINKKGKKHKYVKQSERLRKQKKYSKINS